MAALRSRDGWYACRFGACLRLREVRRSLHSSWGTSSVSRARTSSFRLRVRNWLSSIGYARQYLHACGVGALSQGGGGREAESTSTRWSSGRFSTRFAGGWSVSTTKGVRMLHLTDSLVCLHALTRGRTSSKKLRSSMSRINSLLLCSNSQILWGYVHTDSNPADKPSRWGTRIRGKQKHA